MGQVTVQFLGSGDAFGSGGRFQTCIYVRSDAARFLIDCGASSLVAMKRFGVSSGEIDSILVSHLHGDHFGGIPFLVLDAQFVARRTRRLLIAGPPGTTKRVTNAMELMFPESSHTPRAFPLEIVEVGPERPQEIGGVRVTPYVVEHPSGDPPLALRIECDGRVIAYSGDTAWTPSLLPVARNADLFIAEAYTFDKRIKLHLDYQTLIAHLGELAPKRLVVTHMSDEMLARVGSLGGEFAEDGKIIAL